MTQPPSEHLQQPTESAVESAADVPPASQDHLAAPTAGYRPVVAEGLQMKRRNPIGAWLGLPLITLGIYHLVWYYKIHKEMAMFDRRRVVPVAGPMLVLLFLGWTIIAALVSYYGTGKRIAAAQRAAGMPATCSPGIGLLLMLVFGLGIVYYQSELNKVVALNPGVPVGSRVPLYA